MVCTDNMGALLVTRTKRKNPKTNGWRLLSHCVYGLHQRPLASIKLAMQATRKLVRKFKQHINGHHGKWTITHYVDDIRLLTTIKNASDNQSRSAWSLVKLNNHREQNFSWLPFDRGPERSLYTTKCVPTFQTVGITNEIPYHVTWMDMNNTLPFDRGPEGLG